MFQVVVSKNHQYGTLKIFRPYVGEQDEWIVSVIWADHKYPATTVATHNIATGEPWDKAMQVVDGFLDGCRETGGTVISDDRPRRQRMAEQIIDTSRVGASLTIL